MNSLLGLLLAALRHEEGASGALSDALKEAGYDEEGERVALLFCLKDIVVGWLERRRTFLLDLTDGEHPDDWEANDSEDLEDLMRHKSAIESYEAVLRVMGEPVPPPEWDKDKDEEEEEQSS